jgi:hypothetical protein
MLRYQRDEAPLAKTQTRHNIPATYRSPINMSDCTNDHVPLLTAASSHSVDAASDETVESGGRVAQGPAAEKPASCSPARKSSSGTRIPSLSSIEVQEVVPLVLDVQLEECPAVLSSDAHCLSEASLVLQQQSFSVRTSENITEADSQEEDHDYTPCATACVNIVDWAAAAAAGAAGSLETTTVVASCDSSRPGIIFANAIKPTVDSWVGLHFRARDGGVYISRIADDSLFRDCNFMVGDRVVAVNHISCSDAKKATPVVKLLHKTCMPGTDGSGSQQGSSSSSSSSLEARTVSICVHNQQGDPRTISTSIQKPDRLTPLGIHLVNKRRSGDETGAGSSSSLKVTRIDANSLFANSLLLPRQRCLYMNGMPCNHWSAQEAADFIRAVPDRVTIISEQPSHHQHHGAAPAAMVISASPPSVQPTQQQERTKLLHRLHETLSWRSAKKKLLMPGRSVVSSSSSQHNIPRVTAC